MTSMIRQISSDSEGGSKDDLGTYGKAEFIVFFFFGSLFCFFNAEARASLVPS